ncbi:hypothetical protein FRB94_013768 [Tulasnella sp. JGI-2019a]|nr:hypothetical protein FRB93_007903 [Tulasnella sp. JGI-2019a]KAG8990080.1 hypothetical protein FRB94_013768 [Tulasnella sp. JGI-2019a]
MVNGASMSHPITLDITVSEMNNIMRVLHARQTSAPLALTIQQWSEALHIATIWGIISAREYIIDRISKLFPTQPPIDRIVLADRCGVQKWLSPAYEELCVRSHPPSTEEGIERLGVGRIVAIFTIREALRAPAFSPINDTVWCGRSHKVSEEKTTCVISAENAVRMIKANRVLSLNLAEEECSEAISRGARDYYSDSSIVPEGEPRASLQCQSPEPCSLPRVVAPVPTQHIWISPRAPLPRQIIRITSPPPIPRHTKSPLPVRRVPASP